MRRAHRTLVGLAAGAALLLTGCSDPAPTEVPSASAASASGPASSAGAPSPAPTEAGSTGATSADPQPSASSEPSVEPTRTVATAAPRRLDEPTRAGGAEISLSSVRATTIKASNPLDRSGPGVLVGITVRNTTGRTLDTSLVQVGVVNGAGAPGTVLAGSPTDPLASSVKAGGSARATYAFLLDDASAAPVTVQVYVAQGQPVVQFRGRAT